MDWLQDIDKNNDLVFKFDKRQREGEEWEALE